MRGSLEREIEGRGRLSGAAAAFGACGESTFRKDDTKGV